MARDAHLRDLASTYVKRRIMDNSVLHMDIFAYPLHGVASADVAIKYEFRRGGRGDPLSVMWFAIKTQDNSEPRQIPANHIAFVDLELSDPIRMTAKPRERAVAEWFTDYHHAQLRDIAMLYPVSAFGCTKRSVRFHYFTAPDHDPRHGFKNWYSAPRPNRG